MKFTGIVRKLDPVGRIVIPKEVRDMLSWSDGDEIEMHFTDNGVFLQRREKLCAECGSPYNLISFADRLVCSTCIKRVAQGL